RHERPAMKLYSHEESGNSYKVRLLLSFLEIPCEIANVDLLQDAQHQPAFLAINPRGEVPALVDGDLVLRDSAAILLYLASKHGADRWWSRELAVQAQIVEWLAFAASWVQYGVFTARAMISFGIPANGLPADFQDNLDAAKIRGGRSLDILDAHLKGNDWLVAQRPTIADIAVFPYVALSPMGDISLQPYPAIGAWITRFKQLPSFIAIAGLDDPNYRKG
ncbi:MAG: glutathione S-transferase family protein, partial [Gammaproteobacteria bacterium]